MSNISEFTDAYEALKELYDSGYAKFCPANAALDKKSIDSKRQFMDSNDEEWRQKYSIAIFFAAKIAQTEDVKKKLIEMQDWNETLKKCKDGYVEKAYLSDNVVANPNAQNSTSNNGRI